MVVLLRGQASFLNSANRTHPTTLANSTSHFLSARVQGREGGVRGEREGGVAVVGGRMLSLGNSSAGAPASRSHLATGFRDGREWRGCARRRGSARSTTRSGRRRRGRRSGREA
jgi:hypothetical protein